MPTFAPGRAEGAAALRRILAAYQRRCNTPVVRRETISPVASTHCVGFGLLAASFTSLLSLVVLSRYAYCTPGGVLERGFVCCDRRHTSPYLSSRYLSPESVLTRTANILSYFCASVLVCCQFPATIVGRVESI
jgi:hypothetical protein